MEAITETLQQIETLSRGILPTPDDERIRIYRQLDPLLLRLEARLRGEPDTRRKLMELKFHLLVLTRLDDSDADPDARHLAEAQRLIAELAAPGAFSPLG